MNYSNLYNEAIAAVRLGFTIVHVPADMADQFRHVVSNMPGSEVRLRAIDFINNTAEFVHFRTK